MFQSDIASIFGRC